MDRLPPAFECLRNYNQFVIYRLTPSNTRPGKTDKLPINLSGVLVSAHDRQNWMDFDQAVMGSNALGEDHGVGFVFTHDDPFFFVDIDSCVENSDWSPLAKELMNVLGGAAIEVSQSGTGLHIIGCYSGQEPEHSCKNIPLGLELYTSERFVALTGLHASGNAAVDHVANLGWVIDNYFPYSVGNGVKADDIDWFAGPVEKSRPIKDDEKLIKKALAVKSAKGIFGNGSKAVFKDLWKANESVLALAYPDPERTYDSSSADRALAQHLAFWTGNDCERIERLMRISGLMREKYDKHKSYLYRTVTSAVAVQTSWYDVGLEQKVDLVKPIADVKQVPVYRSGNQMMSATQQWEWFSGCVYVAEVHKIFTPKGQLLKPDQFNAMFGGYSFVMDNDDGTMTTKKAWEVFTESQATTFPKADGFTFNPNLPQGTIVEEHGRRRVNTYVPLDIHTEPGDITPFMNHLKKMIPDERDRNILLSFMAAVIQYKGLKIQWAPLLQGVEGNGKTLVSRAMTYAIGDEYTHQPPASEIAEKFNSWLFNKLLICVEDIYVPHQRFEVLETLKPMITSDRLARRAMQTDQEMHDVCANFIFNSNHKDAIKTTLNDRRYCVFYTAQQDAEHLTRDGMGGNYFPELYEWARSVGYARIAYFLNNYKIPDEFNPSKSCQRAPATSSTAEAIAASLGPVEQQIISNIEGMATHFKGDWVSSYGLTKMFKEHPKMYPIPNRARRTLMQTLGYVPHPALNNGRTSNPLMSEGGIAPILYIKSDSIHMNLTIPSDITAQYLKDQGAVTP